MNVFRVAGAAVLSAALVGALGLAAAPAMAADSAPGCVITFSLPERVAPSTPFTLSLAESSSCAAVTDPQTFTFGGFVASRGEPAPDTGIHFDHTIGSGNASYQGIAPARREIYRLYIQGRGVLGADANSPVMNVTSEPIAPTPTPTPTATATPTATPAPTPITSTPAPVASTAPKPTAPAPVAKKPTPTKTKPAPSKRHRYASCTSVHRVYSGGIAKISVKRDKVKGHHSHALHGTVLRSSLAYKVNKRLDKDHDGIACEKR